MRTITATVPGGDDWAVRVVWLPRWRALARRFGGWRRKRRKGQLDLDLGPGDLPTGGGGGGGGFHIGGGGGGIDFDFGDALIAVLVVLVGFVVAVLLFWFVLLPLLLLVVDVAVVIVLVVFGAAVRVVFRRPWTVEATRRAGGYEQYFATDVVGWRAALRTRDEIAEKLRVGYPAPVVGTLARRPV